MKYVALSTNQGNIVGRGNTVDEAIKDFYKAYHAYPSIVLLAREYTKGLERFLDWGLPKH